MRRIQQFIGNPHIQRHGAVYLLFLGIAILITWPLVRVFSTEFAGGFLTDAYQITRHSWWIQHAIRNGQPIFNQPAMGYPDGLPGALIWANPLQFFPTWLFAIVLPLPAAYNLNLLLVLALNGWSVYWLVYFLTDRQRIPALVAGVVFMTFPALQGRIYGGHPDVLTLWPTPLLLYSLYRLEERFTWRLMAQGALFFVLGLAGNTSLLIYALFPTVGVFLLVRLLNRQWVWLRRSLVTVALGGLLSLILVLPLAFETWTNPQYDPDIGGSVRYSADALGVVAPSFFHPAYDGFDYNRQVLGVNLVEGLAYLGIVPMLLMLVGLWWQRRAWAWLLLAGVAWVFSLGPLLKVEDKPVLWQVDTFEGQVYQTYVTLPWAALKNLPVFDITRTPGRFSLTLGLALAVMAGYGVAVLWQYIPRWRWREALIVPLVALIIWDYQSFWPMPSVDATIPQGIADLAERDEVRAVFNIPWDDRILAKHALLYQTAHQHPLIAGQFIRDTPVNPAKLNLLQRTLDPALLLWAGADVVIWHHGPQDDTLGPLALAQLGPPFYDDARVVLFDVPPADAPIFTTLMTNQSAINTHADSYFFAPQSGWVLFSGTLHGAGREVGVYLDGERVSTLAVNETLVFSLPLPADEAEFYTARLVLDPPCPTFPDVPMDCRTVTIEQLALTDFTPADTNTEAEYEQGLTLTSAYMGPDVAAGQPLTVWLAWHFEQPLTDQDIRFVHVLDANNTIVVQSDVPLGIDYTEMEHWVETVLLILPDNLMAGEYRVVTGWYSYPSIQRFVLAGNPENAYLIGTFEILN